MAAARPSLDVGGWAPDRSARRATLVDLGGRPRPPDSCALRGVQKPRSGGAWAPLRSDGHLGSSRCNSDELGTPPTMSSDDQPTRELRRKGPQTRRRPRGIPASRSVTRAGRSGLMAARTAGPELTAKPLPTASSSGPTSSGGEIGRESDKGQQGSGRAPRLAPGCTPVAGPLNLCRDGVR